MATNALDEILRRSALAYADVLKRQRATSSALVYWQADTRRSHEFVWVGGVVGRERLMTEGRPVQVDHSSRLFESVQKMHATSELNPYEREVLYGYPYVIGRIGGRAIRAPLLTIAVRIDVAGSGFEVLPDDETLRLNTLPFSTQGETAARQLALQRLVQRTPAFPLVGTEATQLKEHLERELPDLLMSASLDGRLVEEPITPKQDEFLELIDQAALFVAPKSSYFLTSDLGEIALAEVETATQTALACLLTGAGAEPQADFEPGAEDTRAICYPFPSNRSQRRVALLVDHEDTRLIRIEGPPGTGKSQTIANLACHLAAAGKSVLITSQRDKALQVVDEKLRELGMPQLPMTLLRHDASSRKELRDRLDKIQKTEPAEEASRRATANTERFALGKSLYGELTNEYRQAVQAEDEYETVERIAREAKGLRRALASWRLRRTEGRLRRTAPRTTAEVAEDASRVRSDLLDQAVGVLESRQNEAVARAQRNARQQIREFAALLKRDQTTYRNFSVFDRLKTQPDRAHMLMQVLPVWIMAPDDVARLFPCEAGLFDVVIVDEASQVDLPSIAPVLFRAKKAVISGDTKQMQPQRFRFTTHMIGTQAWLHHGLDAVDPEGWLNPMKQSLLTLATIRAEEENLLDEHYRSMPPIIAFSNERWYGNALRIMTDESRKHFGGPEQHIIELHHVADGLVTNGSQENPAEAAALVGKLKTMMEDPSYSDASFGVIGLFEEQVSLILDKVADQIDPELWEAHDLVVVNPDGFQGDERDVILYSLSFDNNGMARSALSARQQDSEHIQGMLNVAFTRARDEIHVFHSAPLEEFGFADGKHGALTDWLLHCADVQVKGRVRRKGDRVGKSDSLFEADVAEALRARGLAVTQQYMSCGFYIDMVVEKDGQRLALECDGEIYHHDEHGEQKFEDLERQAILERAGWDVLRIPYRRWQKQPESELSRIEDWFIYEPESEAVEEEPLAQPEELDGRDKSAVFVSGEQKALLEAISEGLKDEDDAFRRAREHLGYARLGNRIRTQLKAASGELERQGYVAFEDGEYYLTQTALRSEFHVRTSIRRSGTSARRTLYSIQCSQCGSAAQVPFKPRGGWPVYCRKCYSGRQRGSNAGK